MHPFLFVLAPMALAAAGSGAAAYRIERLHGKPIVDGADSRKAGTAADPSRKTFRGDAMFPCVVRLPEWLPPDQRAAPSANYYLYFASHHGTCINMAWAERADSPEWTLFNAWESAPLGVGRGVLDLMLAGPEARLDLGGGVAVRSHISSPEVFLNDAERRFYMIFHSPSPIGQISFLATSASGLNFNRPGEGGERGEGVRPFILSPSPYMRLFYKDGTAHAVCHSGYFARPVDPSRPWEIADSLKPAEPSWEVLPRSIFIEEIKSLLGREDELESGALALRHCSLRTSGDGRALEVFFSRAFESPEHILHAVVDISPKDWREWRLMGPPAKLLCAEEPWEGECLHDTHVFEDVGGQLYLFYSCREEDAIAVAKLHAL